MNIKQALEFATAKFSLSCDTPNLDARVLTCLSCKLEQSKLFTEPDLLLTAEQEKNFLAYVERRASGEPIAYITGEKEFWSLRFKVDNHVLIPRPETELLVELTLEQIKNKKSAKILDLGTGSGVIAIAIASQYPNCQIIASDNSEPALDIAKQNAASHKAKIDFIHSDWFANIPEQTFDVIVANPPYIDKNDPHLNEHVYQYEPEHALISKNKGLFDLNKIINQARNYLTHSGILIVEHGFQQAHSVQQLFKQANFKRIKSHKDLAGKLRCSSGGI